MTDTPTPAQPPAGHDAAAAKEFAEQWKDERGDGLFTCRLADIGNLARAYLAQQQEIANDQKRWDRITEALTRWGWSHCTAEVELIQQIDWLIGIGQALAAPPEADGGEKS